MSVSGRKRSSWLDVRLWALCLWLGSGLLRAAEAPSPTGDGWRVEQDGIAVELDIEPLERESEEELREGEGARFRFSVIDTATGQPLSGLYPAAWMSLLDDGEEPSSERCVEKVEEFVGGSLLYQADLDLNVYYVLALNHDATITVVDPLFGFGGTRLLALLNLPSPGEDWALSPDRSRLFVSTPETNRIVVADTVAWRVLHELDPGPRPTRLALQPDGAFLWVSVLSGIAVVDLQTLRLRTTIETGERPHEIAFSDDSRFAFVTNRGSNSTTVIDVRTQRVLRTIETGELPVSVAYSPLAQMAYVSHEGDGQVIGIDGRSHEITARVQAEAGLGQIRFAPGGRLGFVVNPTTDTVSILDVASNRIVQVGDVKAAPDQVAFSDDLAYVRHRDSEQVLMIPLDEVGEEGAIVPVVDFPGGQEPYGRGQRSSPAPSIVQAPGATAVLVASPADKMIYYYKEGMAAPMGGFENYDRQPRAVLVVDRSLGERTRTGAYETAAKLRQPGRYEIAFYLDTPRIVHCFAATVKPDPELEKLRYAAAPVRVEPLFETPAVALGEAVTLRYRLTDPHTGELAPGLTDVQVLTAAAGNWHRRQTAREVEEGIYEVSVEPPAPGVYRARVECLSEGLEYHLSPRVVFQVIDGEPERGGAGPSD